MKSNEPFQRMANFYNAMMYHCINLRERHKRLARNSDNIGNILMHLESAVVLNRIANIHRARAFFFGNAVIINKRFPLFIELIERTD